MRKRTLALFLCSLAVFTVPQRAQDGGTGTAARRPVFSVQSAMVVVDVTVRDRTGKLVADLKPEDFRVFEDGKPQEIVTFSAEKVPIGPTAAAAAGEPAAREEEIVNLAASPEGQVKRGDLMGKRLIILFFDLSSLDDETLIRSVDAGREFLASRTGPQDLLAVATYSSALSLMQDFTNDRRLLLDVLDGISSADSEGEGADTQGEETESEDVFVPDNVEFNIFNTDRRLSAIETIAKMYREFPERKSLVYFSGGVTTTGVENNAQIRSTVDNANRSNMSIYTVDSRGLVALPPGGNASQAGGGSGMMQGGGMMRQRSGFFSSQETLVTLAHDTGGQSFTDLNDLGLAMQQVQADTNVYYVIGYFSSSRKEDGKYRKIKVEAAAPGLKVGHRPGYFASKSFDRLNRQERDFQLQQAMTVDRPFVEVPLILQADYFRKGDDSVYVPISLKLDGDGLEFEDKGENREAKFEFVAQAVDPKGKVTGVARDSVVVRLPAERAERIREGGIFYSTGFELRPGDYNLRLLVRDNVTGKMGSVERPMRVPELGLKTFSLSSIVLGSTLVDARAEPDGAVRHEGAMRRFQMRAPGYDPLLLGDRKIIPSIGNVFLARQTVLVYFQVYGALPDPETGLPCIETDLMLIRDGTKILETRPQYVQSWNSPGGGRPGPGGEGRGMGGPPPEGGGPGDRGDRGLRGSMSDPPGMGGPPGKFPGEERKGEAVVAVSLPLRSLRKGRYTLQIHVRDAIADLNRFERVPLVID